MLNHYNKLRIILIILCLFISIGALVKSILMFISPGGKLLGMDDVLGYFQVLPFSELALLCVNGITNLIATI